MRACPKCKTPFKSNDVDHCALDGEGLVEAGGPDDPLIGTSIDRYQIIELIGAGGMAAVSCRYATLLTWIHDTVHQSGGFCATGNSGGSSEVAYALAHWGRDSILDFAVPTGGPPMGRMDIGCLDGGDSAWQAQCAAHFSDNQICPGGGSCQYINGASTIDMAYTPETPCTSADATFRTTLLNDSVAAPGADYDYVIPVHFIFGVDDCTEAVSLGMEFATSITSQVTVEAVPGTPHATFSTVAGATAIYQALGSNCFER